MAFAQIASSIKSINLQTTTKFNEYLNKTNIKITNTKTIILTDIFKNNLKQNMFDKIDFVTILNDINNEIIKIVNAKKKCGNTFEKNDWDVCKKNCKDVLSKYINMEIDSTAYMLRVLSDSYIRCNNIKDYDNIILHFKIISDKFDLDDLNNLNKWEPLQNIIKNKKNPTFDLLLEIQEKILYLESESNTESDTDSEIKPKIESTQKSPRLIMSFGPSSAGKTRTGGDIIKIIQEENKKEKQINDEYKGKLQIDKKIPEYIPNTFLSIDGGIYREQSIIYMYIVDLLKFYNIGGFKNMVPSGISKKDILFNSKKTKINVINYLIYLKDLKKEIFNISLYIPETLSSCIITCKNEYKQYIDLTGDKKWIALFIWQHKFGPIECNYTDKYKCVGCTQSGKSRETLEGKKYSNNAYNFSYKNGMDELKNAPHIAYKIHNCGRLDGITIIEDFSKNVNAYLKNIEQIDKTNLYKINNKYHYMKHTDNKSCFLSDLPLEEPEPNIIQSPDNTFAKKYLKYKQKYLKLKNSI